MAFIPSVVSIIYMPEGCRSLVQIPPVALNLAQLLDVATAAERIGISDRSLRRAMASRRLAHFRIDGQPYVNEGDLGGFQFRRLRGEA